MDLRRSPDHAAVGGHQADGARAPHGDTLAGTDVRKLRAVIAGRKYVRQEREVRLELVPGRQRQTVEVRVRHLEVFGLTAAPRPHGDVSIRAAREPGVDRYAEARKPSLAVLAEAAAYVERHHDPVASGQRLDSGPDLFDYAHVLVAEDDARLGGGPTLIHVQVGAADATGGDPDDHVIRVLQLGIGNFLYSHTERSLVYDSFHGSPSFVPSGQLPLRGRSPGSPRIISGCRELVLVRPAVPRMAEHSLYRQPHFAGARR